MVAGIGMVGNLPCGYGIAYCGDIVFVGFPGKGILCRYGQDGDRYRTGQKKFFDHVYSGFMD